MTSFAVSGRVAVVTGAGSGIGRATALALGRAGAAVMAADADRAAVEHTASSITASGGEAVSAAVDVTRKAAVDAMADRAARELGPVQLWANVAGVMRSQRAVDVSEADFDAVLAVNLKGVLFGSQAAVRVMTPQGAGSIVNVVSAIIDAAVGGMAGYAVSKAGATMLTKCLAAEVGRLGIRVNAVAPGWTDTAMTRGHTGGRNRSEKQEAEAAAAAEAAKQARFVPLGRAAEPGDVAETVLFLASDASRFMTGQILRPHGGVTMPW